MQQALMSLTSDVASYDLPCLNIKIPEKLLGRRMLEREAGPICSELEQTPAYLLDSKDTEFYWNEEFQYP